MLYFKCTAFCMTWQFWILKFAMALNILQSKTHGHLQRPKATRKRTKFLLRSSAPASCGFMAESVGTRQGSPLRFDERKKPRP
jgi:hypothetical protein